MSGHADQQAVAPDLDVAGGNRLWGRQDAEFDFQMRRFGWRHGMEACVFKSGGARSVCDRTIDRADRKHITYAPAQLAMKVKSGECAARFREMGRWRVEGDVAAFESGKNGIVGEPEKLSSLLG